MYYSGSSIEIIPVALALLKFVQEDLNRCLCDAANFGRDCDTIATIATIAGCLGGALYGAPALRKQWIEIVEAANCDLFQELEGDPSANFRTVAERLVETLYNEQKIAAKRARFLQETLSR
jgi:ADP-ribosylglycohydrolase